MRKLRILALMASVLAVPATGLAQDLHLTATGLPLANAQRPLTLTGGTLQLNGEFTFAKVSVSFTDPLTMTTTTISDEMMMLALGAAYGIMDDLEVGATVLPLQLDPDFDYGNPSLYARYRFMHGDLELGVEAGVTLPVQDGSDLGLEVGVPLDYHLGHAAVLKSGVMFGFEFADPDAIIGMNIPVAFVFNATPNIFVGVETGLSIGSFDDVSESMAIPLGVHAGYTLAAGGGGPLADLGVGFGMPLFLRPATDGDAFDVDLWTLSVFGKVYLDTN